jgi:hypothetical protein
MATVERLAAMDELPDAAIINGGLKISPLEAAVPDSAETLMQQAYGLLPRLKITELLLEGKRRLRAVVDGDVGIMRLR